MQIRQKGAVVLMLCQFFLLAALVLSMTSATAVFSQYKKVQSEAEYRKRFWLVEAGLECAFALFASRSVEKRGSIKKLTSRCDLPANLEVTWVLETEKGEENYLITSTIGRLSLSQRLIVYEKPVYRVIWLKGSWRDFE